MTLTDRVANYLGYKPTRALLQKRGFNVTQTSVANTLNRWSRANTSMDYDLQQSLQTMRAFSRDLTVNSFIGKRFLNLVKTHVVGPNGFSFNAKPRFNDGKLDVQAAIAIKQAWTEFCGRGVCDVTGKLSMIDVDQINVASLARDGEFLVREVIGAPVNDYGYALQLLDTDRLDIQFNNDRLANGNQVVMGVELTPYGRPVAFYILTQHPGSVHGGYTYHRHDRVPAENLHHVFIPERPEQTRGIPWLHAVMTETKNLTGFVEAAIIASRVGASKMGFFTSPDGDLAPLADGTDPDGELYTDVEPGKFAALPNGYDFKPFDPDYPNEMVESFMKAMLRNIASGINVAYHTLSSDLEGVNFSSTRAGTLEERDAWMTVQGFYVLSFKNLVYSNWLKYALLNGRITLKKGSALPAEKYAIYNKPVFNGRRWQWVDPSKDVKANTDALFAKITSHTRVLADEGVDIRELWQEIADEEDLAEELELFVPAFAAPMPAAPEAAPVEPDAPEEPAPEPKDKKE
jgi:lambda family phage portal protein